MATYSVWITQSSQIYHKCLYVNLCILLALPLNTYNIDRIYLYMYNLNRYSKIININSLHRYFTE